MFSGNICIEPTTGILYFFVQMRAPIPIGYGEQTFTISGSNVLIIFFTSGSHSSGGLGSYMGQYSFLTIFLNSYPVLMFWGSGNFFTFLFRNSFQGFDCCDS